MKLFTIIFTAILSAAVVIFGIRGRTDAFSDLSRTRATTEWARQNSDALKKQTDEINRAREELWQKTVRRINASGPEDLLGQWEKTKEGCKARIREENGENLVAWQRALVVVLQTKPGGTPLTAQEKKDLADVKAELAKGEFLTEENEGNKVFPLTLSSLSSLPSVNSSYPTLNVERFLL